MQEHNLSSVLVFSDSHITGIVVCKIVERLGLKSATEKPDCHPQVIDRHRPFLVILDSGADGHACDALLGDLVARRSVARHQMPRVILLAGTNAGPAMVPGHAAIVDHVVAKPVTPDSLQPKILAQLALARAGS